MVAQPQGIERIQNPVGMENDVVVSEGGMILEMPESRYRAKGYQPPCDKLPWREEVRSSIRHSAR
jgi:hypothetical protein